MYATDKQGTLILRKLQKQLQQLMDNVKTYLEQSFKCVRVPPARHVPNLEEDARRGLLCKPRSLPPKYFYDDHGSELFEKICQTSEYYPTRTEDLILQEHAKNIIQSTLPSRIFELGSGSSTKTRRLLDACCETEHFPSYTAFDISESALLLGGATLSTHYDWLQVDLLLGDYEAGFDNMPTYDDSKLMLFLGSTIGNFEKDHAIGFLSELRANMSVRDRLLVGFDRVKEKHILNAAYNDKEGVTAAFNLNLLNVLNKQLGANFDSNKFKHSANYHVEKEQVEMHLVSNCEQKVQFDALGTSIEITSGEHIRTEISRKFTDESVTCLLGDTGFMVEQDFASANGYFSLILAQPI